MWTGMPVPTRPAGGHICTRLSNNSFQVPWVSGTARATFPGLPVQNGGRPLKLNLAVAKDAVPAIISYTVQKGETLWDVAVQHGVSMRTIKDLNKLPGKEPFLTEGQKLLVPASGITAVATIDGATSAAALGSTPARGLWVGSEYVRLASVNEAKELYLRQCDRGNSQNTLLVLYAPWCPHCRDMEDELERMAEGLSHVPTVRVVAVNCDSLEGRMFAREVLGVAYYPSIISFPEHSRTFFKYKGRQRDAESLLRFLNMTCCAREDQMWSLRPVGTHATVVMPGSKWVNRLLPVGTSPGAMAVGLLALVGAASIVVVAVHRRMAATAAASDSTAIEADVVAELDSSLGRMASLMVRAMWTRLALLFKLPGPPQSEPQLPSLMEPDAGAVDMESARSRLVVMASAPALTTTTARQSGGSGGDSNGQHATFDVVLAAAEAPPPPPSMDNKGIGTVAVAMTGVGAAPSVATAALDASPAAMSTRGLTAEERMRLTRLTDDELIALVNSDPDLDKVLSRLLGDK
ncbi:hypothetical protein VaNZ11_000861 [Volvox africanus]|uniref:Thioredoxin domain-containing protein n=1 Tax=Volvox africanus TaxID=51714 RepID=A0ABQ5RN97_9CHLO|nr:hypothetical protein VaNZ11_000861 [Volvox africanus]